MYLRENFFNRLIVLMTIHNVRNHLKVARGVYIVIFCLLSSNVTPAQNGQQKTYDFQVQSQSLAKVLDRLSVIGSVKFAYNAADPSFSKSIDYEAKGKTFGRILSDILEISGHKYTQVGNQLVIYSPEFPPAGVNQDTPENDNSRKTNNPPTVQKVATVYRDIPVFLHDTLLIRDTITKTEKVIVYDTIEKLVYRKRPGFEKLTDFFGFDPDRSEGFFMAFTYGQHYGGLLNSSNNNENSQLVDLIRQTESPGLRNFSAEADLGYNSGRWTFTTGIQLKGFANRFKYNQLITTGGYHRVDTLTWYYNIEQGDTTWFPVTDSVYLPLEKSEVKFDQLNRTGFLELQAGLGYVWFAWSNLRLYIKGSAGYSFMIYNNGIILQDKEGYPGIEYDKMNIRKNMFSWQIGTGASYMATNKLDLIGELVYQNYSSSLFPGYPVGRRYYSVGIKIGVLYFF